MGFAAKAEMDAVGDVQSLRRALRPLRDHSRLWLRGARGEIPWKTISFEINGRIQVSQEISIVEVQNGNDDPSVVRNTPRPYTNAQTRLRRLGAKFDGELASRSQPTPGNGEVRREIPSASVSLKGSFYARSDLARLLPPIYPGGPPCEPITVGGGSLWYRLPRYVDLQLLALADQFDQLSSLKVGNALVELRVWVHYID